MLFTNYTVDLRSEYNRPDGQNCRTIVENNLQEDFPEISSNTDRDITLQM